MPNDIATDWPEAANSYLNFSDHAVSGCHTTMSISVMTISNVMSPLIKFIVSPRSAASIR